MIVLERISKNYKNADHSVTALDGIDLRCGSGEVCAVVGHSGAGKTALLRCITLLDAPDSGCITLDARRISRLRTRDRLVAQRQMGAVLQEHGLLASRTVADNVALPLRWVRSIGCSVQVAVTRALDKVGMLPWAGAHPADLTSAQCRRVALARAIVHSPRLLLCDGLPAGNERGLFLALLQDIQRASRITMILVARTMDKLDTLCDRIAVLNHGQIIEDGPLEALVRNPRRAITYDLVQWGVALPLPGLS